MMVIFLIGHFLYISKNLLIIIWLLITLGFFYRTTIRYNKDLIVLLTKKWRSENRYVRTLKGYGIFLMLIFVYALTVIFGFLVLPKY